jgi:hypothetical protein
VKRIGVWVLSVVLVAAHLFFRSTLHAGEWMTVQPQGKSYEINFPQDPKKIQQFLSLTENQWLLYDVYSAPYESDSVVLLLTTEVPLVLFEGKEQETLQNVLKTLVDRDPSNRMVFLDSIQIGDTLGRDFLVQNETHSFRGILFMAGIELFMIAMEGPNESLDEKAFMQFVTSFQFTN